MRDHCVLANAGLFFFSNFNTCQKKDQPVRSYGLEAISTSPKGVSGTDAERSKSKKDSSCLGLPSATTSARGNAQQQSDENYNFTVTFQMKLNRFGAKISYRKRYFLFSKHYKWI